MHFSRIFMTNQIVARKKTDQIGKKKQIHVKNNFFHNISEIIKCTYKSIMIKHIGLFWQKMFF